MLIAQNAIVFRDMYLQFSGRQNNLHVSNYSAVIGQQI